MGATTIAYARRATRVRQLHVATEQSEAEDRYPRDNADGAFDLCKYIHVRGDGTLTGAIFKILA